MHIYRGSCLCGGVTYEIEKFLPDAAHCHCSMCRKFHGAAFATFGTVTRDNFRWASGDELRKDYTADNDTTRTFCRICGSSLTFVSVPGGDHLIHVALGTMDGEVPLKPSAHVYAADAATWADLHDDLPKYRRYRDSPEIGE